MQEDRKIITGGVFIAYILHNIDLAASKFSQLHVKTVVWSEEWQPLSFEKNSSIGYNNHIYKKQVSHCLGSHTNFQTPFEAASKTDFNTSLKHLKADTSNTLEKL